MPTHLAATVADPAGSGSGCVADPPWDQRRPDFTHSPGRRGSPSTAPLAAGIPHRPRPYRFAGVAFPAAADALPEFDLRPTSILVLRAVRALLHAATTCDRPRPPLVALHDARLPFGRLPAWWGAAFKLGAQWDGQPFSTGHGSHQAVRTVLPAGGGRA